MNLTKIARPERVIQFGEGGFLRAFCDWMIDKTNEATDMDAGVVIVQPIERGMIGMLNEQDGLYTQILRGVVDGKAQKDTRIIQCVKRGLSPYEDFEGYLALAHNKDMRFIISNTTEAGIVYTGKDSFDDKPQASFPGKLTRLLYERFTAFGGAKGTGFILLPCELIDYNGRNLKECCLKTAEQWGLSAEFKAWIEEENVFTSTLVDRIVTGYPRDEVQGIWEKLGYEDRILVTAEPFGLWVIESDKDISAELPLPQCGLPVIYTDNQKPYKQRKVRILNGAHTSFVPAAFQCGHDIVLTAMNDEIKGLKKEIESYKAKEAAGAVDQMLSAAECVGCVKVLTKVVPNSDPGKLRQLGDVLRDKDASVVAVLATQVGEKLTILAVCGKDAVKAGVKAGDIVKNVCTCCGGSGGGKPDSAMGGGKDASKLPEALAGVAAFVGTKLK